jgi:hypothetical protein
MEANAWLAWLTVRIPGAQPGVESNEVSVPVKNGDGRQRHVRVRVDADELDAAYSRLLRGAAGIAIGATEEEMAYNYLWFWLDDCLIELAENFPGIEEIYLDGHAPNYFTFNSES